jgi:hypothetical protein
MKKLILGSVLLMSAQVMAADYELVSASSGAHLCVDSMSITKNGDKLTIVGSGELADHFTAEHRGPGDSDLVIKNINKGPVKAKSKNSAHGERISQTSEATYANKVLKLTMETKYGTLVTSKAEGELTISFRDDGLSMQIDRSYDEAFSSSGDWSSSQSCEYKLLN